MLSICFQLFTSFIPQLATEVAPMPISGAASASGHFRIPLNGARPKTTRGENQDTPSLASSASPRTPLPSIPLSDFLPTRKLLPCYPSCTYQNPPLSTHHSDTISLHLPVALALLSIPSPFHLLLSWIRFSRHRLIPTLGVFLMSA